MKKQNPTQNKVSILLSSLLLACNNSGDSRPVESTTGQECFPGFEACPCSEDKLCLKGLTCLSNICVDQNDLTTGNTSVNSTDASVTDTASDTDAFIECEFSSDCLNTEVCVDGFCGDTDLFYFDVRVEYFEPPICEDGFGTAELFFDYYVDEFYTYTSSIADCPANWNNESLSNYDSLLSFRLKFWELDTFIDDLLVDFCWTDEFGVCKPVPKNILHQGYYDDNFNSAFISIKFSPVLY